MQCASLRTETTASVQYLTCIQWWWRKIAWASLSPSRATPHTPHPFLLLSPPFSAAAAAIAAFFSSCHEGSDSHGDSLHGPRGRARMDNPGGRVESVLQGGQLCNITVILGLNDVLRSKTQKIDINSTGTLIKGRKTIYLYQHALS